MEMNVGDIFDSLVTYLAASKLSPTLNVAMLESPTSSEGQCQCYITCSISNQNEILELAMISIKVLSSCSYNRITLK